MFPDLAKSIPTIVPLTIRQATYCFDQIAIPLSCTETENPEGFHIYHRSCFVEAIREARYPSITELATHIGVSKCLEVGEATLGVITRSLRQRRMCHMRALREALRIWYRGLLRGRRKTCLPVYVCLARLFLSRYSLSDVTNRRVCPKCIGYCRKTFVWQSEHLAL